LADSQIEVVIKAVDEISGTIKNIEGKIDGLQKQAEANGHAIGKTFQDMGGAVLVLGQSVDRVIGIMNMWQNYNIRLENAQDRLLTSIDNVTKAQWNLEDATKAVAKAFQSIETAQKNLKKAQDDKKKADEELIKAQENVKKVMADSNSGASDIKKAYADLDKAQKNVTKTTEDVTTAEEDILTASENYEAAIRKQVEAKMALDAANRIMERSERAVQKTQNDGIQVMLQMGLQSATLLLSIPTMVSSIVTLATANGGLAASLTAVSIAGLPVWAVILAIIAAVALVIGIVMRWSEIMEFMKNRLELAKVAIEIFGLAFRGVWEQMKLWALEGTKFIIEKVENMVNKLVKGINKIIDGINVLRRAMGMSTISHIGEVDFGTKALRSAIEAQKKIVSGLESQLIDKLKIGIDLEKEGWTKFKEIFTGSPEKIDSSTSGNMTVVNIDKIQGTDPTDLSKALKKELNGLVVA